MGQIVNGGGVQKVLVLIFWGKGYDMEGSIFFCVCVFFCYAMFSMAFRYFS